MNLQEGTRRILILALLLWSPAAFYLVWEEWPKDEFIVGYPDPEAVSVGTNYLLRRPLTAEQSARYRKAAEEYLRRYPDYFPDGLRPGALRGLMLDLAAHDAAYEHWDLRLQLWLRKRADAWQALGLYLILPIAAAFVLLKIGVPILAWAFAGFKAPPASKPQD